MIWGSWELDEYINALVMDSRDGSRKGLPIAVGGELLWLAHVNKWRRALDYQERFSLSLHDARAKVQMEDDARTGVDLWGDPGAGGVRPERRYTDKAFSLHPYRRREDRTVLKNIFGALTSKLALISIIVILVLKDIWPSVKALF